MVIDATRGIGEARNESTAGVRVRDERPQTPGPNRMVKMEKMVERCGADVIRLVDRPVRVATTLLGTGFRVIRVRRSSAMSGLQGGRLSFEADEETLEFRGKRSRLAVGREAWSAAFLRIGYDRDRSILVVYDRRGRPTLEVVLDREDLKSLARLLPELEHDEQRPDRAIVPNRRAETFVSTDVDDARVLRHWKRPADYDHIDKLERGFRVDRIRLFEALPVEWAAPIGPEAVRAAAAAAAELECRCSVETVGPTFRHDLQPDAVHRGADGGPVVAVGSDARSLIDLRDVSVAYLVRKPTTRGLAAGIELFDERRELQVRLRLSSDADLRQRLIWRSSLSTGRVCTGED